MNIKGAIVLAGVWSNANAQAVILASTGLKLFAGSSHNQQP